MGEFLSPDPLAYIDLYNLYGFAAYDPINGWDPFGMEEEAFTNKAKKVLKGAANEYKNVMKQQVGNVLENFKNNPLGCLGSPSACIITAGITPMVKQMGEEIDKAKDTTEAVERVANVINPMDDAAINADKMRHDADEERWEDFGTDGFRLALSIIGTVALVEGGLADAKKLSGKSGKPSSSGGKKPGKGKCKGGMCTGTKCFREGTLVDTVDGKKKIENVEVGDLVLSYDFDTQEEVIHKVIRLFPGETTEWVHIQTNEGAEIVATPGHDFWIASEGRWLDAIDLQPDMLLRTSEGKNAYVVSLFVEELEKPARTYNFEVEHTHNYYVGDSGVLVHNKGCSPPVLDESGRIHGEIPTHVSKRWSRERLLQLKEDLLTSIKNRRGNMERLGEEGGHRRRLGQEEAFLKQVKKALNE